MIEAKDNNYTVSHGIQQALGYAEILEVPSAYSSNGDAFASHNKAPAPSEDIETEFPLESFPLPPELWKRYKTFRATDPFSKTIIVGKLRVARQQATHFRVNRSFKRG